MEQASSTVERTARKRKWGSGEANFNYRHGLSARSEYFIWKAMIRRCENPNIGESYARYGARGIRVCERWRLSLADFIADVGPRPSPKHTLDRIDSNGHYEPGNVRWSLKDDQNLNKRTTRMVIYQGSEMPLRLVCQMTGTRFHTVQCRLDRGWDLERALSEPPRKSRWK